MKRADLAWRGFVTTDLEVIAWPTLLAQHNDFHNTFYSDDSDFAGRWRQWQAGAPADFDAGASPEAVAAVERWLITDG